MQKIAMQTGGSPDQMPICRRVYQSARGYENRGLIESHRVLRTELHRVPQSELHHLLQTQLHRVSRTQLRRGRQTELHRARSENQNLPLPRRARTFHRRVRTFHHRVQTFHRAAH